MARTPRTARTARRSSRRSAPRRDRTYGRATRLFVVQATGTLTAGTARATDLTASIESQIGESLEGALIKRVDVVYSGRPVATGASGLVTAFFRGPSTLDVADLAPNTDPGQNWMQHRRILTYGQRHLVATTPTLEFDEFNFRTVLKTPLRLRAFGDALWFVEESATQNWEATWSAAVWYSRA